MTLQPARFLATNTMAIHLSESIQGPSTSTICSSLYSCTLCTQSISRASITTLLYYRTLSSLNSGGIGLVRSRTARPVVESKDFDG